MQLSLHTQVSETQSQHFSWTINHLSAPQQLETHQVKEDKDGIAQQLNEELAFTPIRATEAKITQIY